MPSRHRTSTWRAGSRASTASTARCISRGRAFDEIYDVYAVRIIVDTVIECYNVLGIVHDMFRPIPNRFKDYISTPKPNMYQSLHTTVHRTRRASPLRSRSAPGICTTPRNTVSRPTGNTRPGISAARISLEERLAWVRQLLEAQQESDDAEDIVRTIKTDLAPEEVFVFTPKGDVISLPAGSTVIDFAYAIHTAVGNRMIGAKVDGRIVPIWTTVVKTGMIVEIITTKDQGHGPSRDWLKIVKTSEARNKIRAWFKKEKREENIAAGREELEREFQRSSISLTEQQRGRVSRLSGRTSSRTDRIVDDFLRCHRLWRHYPWRSIAAPRQGATT